MLLSMQPFDVQVISTAQKNDTVNEFLIYYHKPKVSFDHPDIKAKNNAVTEKHFQSRTTTSRDSML